MSTCWCSCCSLGPVSIPSLCSLSLHTTGLRQQLVTRADIFISTKRTFQVKAGANLQIIVNPVTNSVTLAGTRSGLGLTKTLKTLALKCPWHLHTFRDRYFVTILALTRLVNNQNCYERNWTRSKQRQSIPFKICLVHPNIPPHAPFRFSFWRKRPTNKRLRRSVLTLDHTHTSLLLPAKTRF